MDFRIEIIGEGFNENIYLQLRDSLEDLLAGRNILMRETEKGFERLHFFPEDYEGPFGKIKGLAEHKGTQSLVVFYLDLQMDIVRIIKRHVDFPENKEFLGQLSKIKEQCTLSEKDMMDIVQRILEVKKTFHVEFVETVSGSPKN